MEEKTSVMFRKFINGDIVAIFPEEEGDNNLETCMAYFSDNFKKRSYCEPNDIINITVEATPNEYEKFQQKLKDIGFVMKVVKKITTGMSRKRKNKYKNNWGLR